MTLSAFSVVHAIDRMVGRTGKFQPEFAWHDQSLIQSDGASKSISEAFSEKAASCTGLSSF
jgi:hypothetical protein